MFRNYGRISMGSISCISTVYRGSIESVYGLYYGCVIPDCSDPKMVPYPRISWIKTIGESWEGRERIDTVFIVKFKFCKTGLRVQGSGFRGSEG